MLTQLSSNRIQPPKGTQQNPGWTQSEQAEPEASIFVEKVHDRTGLIHGESLYQQQGNNDHFIPITGSQLAQAEFVFACSAFTNATGIEVEWVNFHTDDIAPSPLPSSDNLNLAGDVNSSLANVRHTLDLTQNNILYVKNLTTQVAYEFPFHIPTILSPNAYFTFTYGEILTKLKEALHYAMEHISSAPTFSEIYITSTGKIAFFFDWTGEVIDINWSEVRNANVAVIIRNFLSPVGYRDNVTYGTHTGFQLEFDMGIAASQPTFPNGTFFMTLHSQELTMYRKQDCVCPTDGDSHIATIFPHFAGTGLTSYQISPLYRKTDQTLVSPKIAYQKMATIEEFRVIAKLATVNPGFANGPASQVLMLNSGAKCYMNLGLKIT